MAIMSYNMLAAVSSIWKPIISLLDWMNSGIGNFGWTVVVFTLLLRLFLMPFDIWQKISMRKQKSQDGHSPSANGEIAKTVRKQTGYTAPKAI